MSTTVSILLFHGSRGEQVERAQAALNSKGAQPPLDVDGVFGPATTHAVRAFQSGAGLDVDGMVGPLTWSALGLAAPAATPTLSQWDADPLRFVHLVDPGENPMPPTVTSGFGWRADPLTGERSFHNARDHGRREGAGFYALTDGEVDKVWSGDQWNGYGLRVRCYNGCDAAPYRWGNIHMQAGLSARVGQRVDAGDLIGRVGSTGRVTGPHEHLWIEVMDSAGNWHPDDPGKYLEYSRASA